MIKTFEFFCDTEPVTVKIDVGLSWNWQDWEYNILRCYTTDRDGKETDVEVTSEIEEAIDNELAELDMPDRNDTDMDYDAWKDDLACQD